MTNPTNIQLKVTKKKAAKELFAILFMYLVDHQKYRKVIEDMENKMLQKKDPFPKDVGDASRLLDGWKNNFSGRSIRTEANDGVASTTISEDKEEPKKTGKKKKVTCFRCKKVGPMTVNVRSKCPRKTKLDLTC